MNTQVDADMDRELVSALMDGRLYGADLTAALRAMSLAETRECWLVYHTIGDVLRSAELAECGHDTAFVSRLSQRLSAETARPAQIEAAAAVRDASRPAANDGVFRWKMAAGLASLVAVAAIGWSALGGLGPQGGAPQFAQRVDVPAGRGAAEVVALAPVPVPAAAASISGAEADPESAVMLRDARLDELLAAHRAAAGVSALGNSAGFLRNATFEGTGR